MGLSSGKIVHRDGISVGIMELMCYPILYLFELPHSLVQSNKKKKKNLQPNGTSKVKNSISPKTLILMITFQAYTTTSFLEEEIIIDHL